MNKEEKIIVFSLITVFIISIIFLSILIINRQQDNDNEDQDTDFSEHCFDSDNGKNYYKKGEVYIQGNVNPSVIDKCYGNNLNEGICVEDGGSASLYYNCPNGCQDGRCLEQKIDKNNNCEDPDGGLNYYLKTTIHPENLTDECLDKTNLMEYRCTKDNNIYKNYQMYECPSGCSDGACLSQCNSSLNKICDPNEQDIENKYDLKSLIISNDSDNLYLELEITGNDVVISSTPIYVYFAIEQGAAESKIDFFQDKYKVYTSKTKLSGSYNILKHEGQPKIVDNIYSAIIPINSLFNREYTSFFQWTFWFEGKDRMPDQGYLFYELDKGIINCNDSDSGKDYYKKGTIKVIENGEQKERIEICSLDGTTLGEWYCSESKDRASMLQYHCPNGCSEGACLKGPNTSYPDKGDKCVDSDGGRNFGVKGTIWGLDSKDKKFMTRFDTCSSLEEIIEAECNINGSNEIFWDTYKCPDGTKCQHGACINSKSTCWDTDRSNSPNIDGTTTGIHEDGTYFTHRDECVGTKKDGLNEHYCSLDNKPESRYYLCEFGCSNGQCKGATPRNPECTDTDDGMDYENKGTIFGFYSNGYSYSLADKCNTKGNVEGLYEYYCIDNKNYSQYYPCGKGCKDGACVKEY